MSRLGAEGVLAGEVVEWWSDGVGVAGLLTSGMWSLGSPSSHLLVGGIRTNLDILRPSNLTVLADVNRTKNASSASGANTPPRNIY